MVPIIAEIDFLVIPSIRYKETIVINIITITADKNGEYPLYNIGKNK